MAAFLGASYFRAVGRERQYGISARGLAVDTALRPLLASGIRPHLIVATDPTPDNARHLADLPDAWSDGMADLLGIRPSNHAHGCLQDIHWFRGAYGYFPTYTLGNLYAAQLWAAVRRDLPDLDDQLARGECGALLGWLRERIHRPGRLYLPAELIERATGAPPQPEHLVRYLNDKLGRLYGLA